MNPISGITLRGIQAVPVEVEVETTGGLFQISVVGLPDTAVKEARERIRAALRSVGINVKGRVAINLAPADIPKEGALLDLSMAVGIACSQGGIKVKRPSLFLGELALDGRLRKVKGAVPAAFLAKEKDMDLYIPEKNALEVGLIDGIKAFKVPTLGALFDHLKGKSNLSVVEPTIIDDVESNIDPDLSDIKGQVVAKRALEIAAAGHHNILFVGSPGSGKTMIAKRIPTILPPMSFEESVETTKIWSVSGLIQAGESLVKQRPFRSPHHTTSSIALIGGGSYPKPGEVSLAHNGVLFLDELTEFRRDVLEVLRQPLEDKIVTVSRAKSTLSFPASFMLIASMNPCQCGHYGDANKECTCNQYQITKYRSKISGPLMDRIDIQIEVPALKIDEITTDKINTETSNVIKQRVIKARNIQYERFKDKNIYCNAQMGPKEIKKYCVLNDKAKDLLKNAIEKLGFSARAYDRILKVARTIADLAQSDTITSTHIAEAIKYRSLDK